MLQTVGIIAIAMNIVRSHEALWTKCLFRRNKGLMSSPIIQQTCRLSAKSPIVSTGQGLHFAHHFGLKTVHVTDPMMAELCSFLGGRRGKCRLEAVERARHSTFLFLRSSN